MSAVINGLAAGAVLFFVVATIVIVGLCIGVFINKRIHGG